jgi:cyclic pyranopterin phosphate synthase
MKRLSHIDKQGRARMVDISRKQPSLRKAVARGTVSMNPGTLDLIHNGKVPKGDVLCVARIAGIMAAKRTSSIIPLCHPLNINMITVDFALNTKESRIDIEATVKVNGQTGAEMEALSAVAAASLTIYDMCKAVDREMVISDVMLIEKRGGKSGTFRRK